jgi:hypothetical protein
MTTNLISISARISAFESRLASRWCAPRMWSFVWAAFDGASAGVQRTYLLFIATGNAFSAGNRC